MATSTPSLSARMWDGLVAEEWAVETPQGPRLELDPVQWDWLWLIATSRTGSLPRAQARALQALLARAGQRWQRQSAGDLITMIRPRLLTLPQRGFPTEVAWADEPYEPPDICSVAQEPSQTAELFWCYGFPGGRRDAPEGACVLLIVLCRDDPAPAEIAAWRRELENEERLLPAGSSRAQGKLGRSRRELWLVTPGGAFVETAGAERRVSLETFARWLEAGATSSADSAGPVR